MGVTKTPYGNMHMHTIGLMPMHRINEGVDIFLKPIDNLKKIIVND